jgi:hypothetical protein
VEKDVRMLKQPGGLLRRADLYLKYNLELGELQERLDFAAFS